MNQVQSSGHLKLINALFTTLLIGMVGYFIGDWVTLITIMWRCLFWRPCLVYSWHLTLAVMILPTLSVPVLVWYADHSSGIADCRCL